MLLSSKEESIPPTRSRILPSLIPSNTYGSAIETDNTVEFSEPEPDSEFEGPKLKS